MPHIPGHSPFDIYALRGEGGEETTSMDIMRRRAEEQARNFSLAPEPAPTPGQQFESSMANAAAQQQQQFEELERQRREAEQRAQELARIQDIENRLAQMQAASPPAFAPAPQPVQYTPPPPPSPITPGFQGVGLPFEAPEPATPESGGLIDPRDVASQQFTDIGESIISSEGQLFGNLIREALDNGKNVYSPTVLGMRQDVFGFGGLSQYEQFNKLLEIEQRQGNTIADVLFKYTGTGPNTEVGRALSLLAQANGNLSGLPARQHSFHGIFCYMQC